jgi:hypothetical protein
LPGIHPFVEAYIMLMALEGHAVPVDEGILAVLRDHEIVEEQTSLEEAQRFMEHHLKADEAYEFFVLIRRASQDGGKRKSK